MELVGRHGYFKFPSPLTQYEPNFIFANSPANEIIRIAQIPLKPFDLVNKMSKKKLTKLSQERIVNGIIFDSEMFYQPNKRKLKYFTSTGTKIIYPRCVKQSDDLKIKKNKSFLHSKSCDVNFGEREKLWHFHRKLNLIIKSHYNDLKKLNSDFIFAEKFSYFEPNFTGSFKTRHKNVKSNSLSYPSKIYVENISRSISVKHLVSSFVVALLCFLAFLSLKFK